jgi:hypothetical protein
MKTIHQVINEKLNVSNVKQRKPVIKVDPQKTYSMEYIDYVKEYVEDLEDIINDICGFKAGTITLTVDHLNYDYICIESNDLKEHFGKIGEITYKKFYLQIVSNLRTNEHNGDTYIYFKSEFRFEYNEGGSNGTTAFWRNGVDFNLSTGEWTTGQLLNK